MRNRHARLLALVRLAALLAVTATTDRVPRACRDVL